MSFQFQWNRSTKETFCEKLMDESTPILYTHTHKKIFCYRTYSFLQTKVRTSFHIEIEMRMIRARFLFFFLDLFASMNQWGFIEVSLNEYSRAYKPHKKPKNKRTLHQPIEKYTHTKKGIRCC